MLGSRQGRRPKPDRRANKRLDNRSDDWRGARFLWIACSITISASLFFFGVKTLYPKIQAFYGEVTSTLAAIVDDWGGIRVETMEVSIVPDSQDPLMMSYRAHIEEELKPLRGQSFWLISPTDLQKSWNKYPWIEQATVARRFPDTLQVTLQLRRPRFVVKTRSQWALVDESARVLSLSREIPGLYTELPIVFGREALYSRATTLEGLNRNVDSEAKHFKELTELVEQLASRLELETESIQLNDDAWHNETVAQLRVKRKDSLEFYSLSLSLSTWRARFQSLQFVLSDLRRRQWVDAEIKGQFEERWIVSQRPNEGGLN